MYSLFYDLKVGEKFQFNGATFEKISAKKALKLEGKNPGKNRSFLPLDIVWFLFEK